VRESFSSGKLEERSESGEARAFYTGLNGAVRVGIEATGHTAWFEALLAELWKGDAAKIRAAVVPKQKTDARDAAHLLDLLCTNRFPTIWRPSLQERDLRQLLWHRQKLVWMWGAVKNQMHALAMGEGVCRIGPSSPAFCEGWAAGCFGFCPKAHNSRPWNHICKLVGLG